ncbi:RluA family pseudouridine synthase [Loigolactobacillus zhaoyuanensis]|uniref:Pseudouridine synthase n=1 Tax=Loigolactobacillus zhaoyuanensis TaxID=2486017 RepID=A0ABW8UDQ6_9LACO|nr:RluA family pseudouridine synthase [Loigolactobacillus zhaoyuanensis]
MIFNWPYNGATPQNVRTFLLAHGISRTLLKKIKFHGGELSVAGQPVTVRTMLIAGQKLTVRLPTEAAPAVLSASEAPLTIIWEDAHFLVVDKPAQVASLPSHLYPTDTMANRVLGYYQRQGYTDQGIHIVTRLDRGTSGLMIFAKHAFAHTLLSQQLHTQQLQKTYLAVVSGQLAYSHNRITLPIKRAPGSFIKRTTAVGGRAALTEYWRQQQFAHAALVKVRLHTGRTHQIRVHFAAIGHPLLGDLLYAGPQVAGLERPALHCAQLQFYQPFLDRELSLHSDLPADLQQLMLTIKK